MEQTDCNSKLELGIDKLKVSRGDHIGHFYETQDGWKQVITDFVSTGLNNGDLCMCLTRKEQELIDTLKTASVDTDQAIASGQLQIYEGSGDPERLQQVLNECIARLDGEGHLLRWVGDMTWSLGKMQTSENLMKWETHCNVVADAPAVFLCQYEISAFTGDVILDAMKTHPICIIGNVIHQNQFYLKPEHYLDELRNREPHTLHEH